MPEKTFGIRPENHIGNVSINTTPVNPAATIPVTPESPKQPSIYGKITNVSLMDAATGPNSGLTDVEIFTMTERFTKHTSCPTQSPPESTRLKF